MLVIGKIDLLDIRAQALELGDHIRIAAFNVIDVRDACGAVCHQSGDHHRRAGTQVGRLDRSTGQLTALDDRESALDRDLRAHANELADILIAVIPHALIHDGGSLDGGQQRDKLRLTVGRETGVRHRLDVDAVERTLGRVYDDRLIIFFDLTAHLHELGADALKMLRGDVADRDPASGRGGGSHIGARLDLVGNDGIGNAAQIIHAADLDNVGTGAADVGAHRVEEVRQINDMRFLGGVLEDGLTLRLDSGEHQVDGRADRYGVEIHSRAVEGAGGSALDDRAVDEFIVRTHHRKALEVLVDRTHAEVTAAGQSDLRVMESSQERAQQIIGRAHAAHRVMGRLPCVDGSGIDIQSVLIDAAHHRAHILQDIRDQRHVGDVRDVFDTAGLVTQHYRRDDRNRRVFRAADSYFAE